MLTYSLMRGPSRMVFVRSGLDLDARVGGDEGGVGADCHDPQANSVGVRGLSIKRVFSSCINASHDWLLGTQLQDEKFWVT